MSGDLSKIEAGNLFRVDGLVAVVTGGGSGLGRMITRALATNGASKIFVVGRREDKLNETVNSILGGGDKVIPLVGDVTSKQSLQQVVAEVKKHVDSIDILFANSGIGGPAVAVFDEAGKTLPVDQLVANMWKPEPEEITASYAVNLTGIHFTVAAFLPLLDAANKKRPNPPTAENFKPRPQIITTCSIGGYNRRPLGNLSYGPSKAAALHLTKQLATTLADHDIRANALAPGLYFTEMTEGMYKAQGKVEIHNVEGTFDRGYIPATRSGDEQDFAGAILFLASRAGAYINGCVLVTDGGRLSVLPASY